MRLTSLNPTFVCSGGEGITDSATNQPVPLREGVGLGFDCPCGKCGIRCFVAFENPLDGQPPHPGLGSRWQRTGDTFETMSLTPSILRTLPHGCGWHGFLTNGELVSC